MICVHPTVTYTRSSLMRLEMSTGLKVVLGNSYLRLVNADGSSPRSKPISRRAAPYSNNDFTPGGNAA